MMALAVPLVLAELGWMMMGVVDVLMVGRLGAEALGGISIGRSIWILVALGGIGILLGLDTVISQSMGRGREDESRCFLAQGIWLAVLLAVPMTLTLQGVATQLHWLGLQDGVVGHSQAYLQTCSLSLLPMLLYTAFRRYLQALDRAVPIMLALVAANFVNIVFNWVLVFGNLGFPRLGTAGAGWATTASMSFLALTLGGVIIRSRRGLRGVSWSDGWWRFESARIVTILRLGVPAAGQLLLEIGVITTVTILAGQFSTEALAAHQVALTLASVTYMIPLGISSAAAVRVGYAIGQGDRARARRAGWTAIGLAAVVMTAVSIVIALFPNTLLALFTEDRDVIQRGVVLLYLAALFQLFDGIQVSAAGALRGAGNTLGPMFWVLLGWWVIGLPLGALLAFRFEMGVAGLWTGLTAALLFMGVALLGSWIRTSRHLQSSLGD